jgi:hypothetical protein
MYIENNSVFHIVNFDNFVHAQVVNTSKFCILLY